MASRCFGERVEKKMSLLFSVVIPLYNKADTIERTLRSVQAQKCRDFELIIVNDGSTDNSLEVVRALSNEIPLQIIDKPNGGVSSARNAGASAAKGRFIALLDGDDVWFPDHLERLKKAVSYPRSSRQYVERTAADLVHQPSSLPIPAVREQDHS